MGCKGEAKRPRLNVYLTDEANKKLMFVAGARGLSCLSLSKIILEDAIELLHKQVLKEIKES